MPKYVRTLRKNWSISSENILIYPSPTVYFKSQVVLLIFDLYLYFCLSCMVFYIIINKMNIFNDFYNIALNTCSRVMFIIIIIAKGI